MGLAVVFAIQRGEVAKLKHALAVLTFHASLVEGLAIGIPSFHRIDGLTAEKAFYIVVNEAHFLPKICSSFL